MTNPPSVPVPGVGEADGSGRLERAQELLGRGEDLVAGVLLLALASVVLVDVVQRFSEIRFIKMASAEEVARILLVWLTFLGAALVYRRREHIRLTLGTDRLGERAAFLVLLLQEALVGGFLVIFALQSWALVRDQAILVTPAMGLPGTVFGLPLLLGGCITLLHLVLRVFMLFQHRPGMRRRWTE